MRRAVSIAVLWLTTLAARLPAASHDERILDDLRGRRQFELAEKYCTERLDDAQLPFARRLDLTIELSRSFADHALDSPPATSAPLWEQARRAVDAFAVGHPRHPRLTVVRAQGALVAVAQGEAAREDAGAGSDDPSTFDAARDLLRTAIGQLRRLDEEVAAELQRAARPGRAADEAALSTAELMSLQLHLRYQLARGLRNQGLCYAPGSADRVNSLAQALELLSGLAQQQLAAPLAWNVRLDEVACRRLLEEYGTAERKLTQLEKASPPADAVPRLTAERIRLALARGRIDEALSEAGRAAARQQASSAEADSARLEAYLAAWQRAVERHIVADAAEWEKTALEQVRAIEQTHGSPSTRRAESLLARSLTKSAGSESVEALVRTAGGLYRGGQIDQALSAYDQAARRAREQHEVEQAVEIAFTAATIEKERQHFREAIDRYRKLAIFTPADARAAEAHLLAIHCAAQWAAEQQPPKLDEYERLLREHVATWPRGPTASQAWWWLGRVAEHQQSYGEATRALRNVKADHPQYAAAVEASGRCYEAWFAQLRRDGKSTAAQAKEAVSYFEQAIRQSRDARGRTPAARAAVLAAARIWLLEFSDGAAHAESLLSTALAGDQGAPPEWQAAARSLLAVALAARGRTGEAEAMHERVSIGSAAEALALVNLLATMIDRAPGNRQQALANFELRVLEDLLAKRDELDGTTLDKVSHLRAAALAKAARRSEAIAALESLAQGNPRDGQVQEDLASLLMTGSDAGELAAAKVKWREITTKSRPGSPRWFRAHYGLARTELALGDAAQARATLTRVEAQHPDWGGPSLKAQIQELLVECQRQVTAASSPAKK